MRAPAAIAVAVAATGMVVGLLACFDLFHSTGDVVTACTIDAHTPGCPDGAPAAVDSGVDFCAWDGGTARAQAERTCAWLGACETPLGRNAFGECMFQALLAFDCTANPSHPARGKAHDLWSCLATAASASAPTCASIDACVFPHGTQPCANQKDSVACGTAGSDDTTNNFDVRVECNDGGIAHGENCALWGQTCATLPPDGGDPTAICAGTRAPGAPCLMGAGGVEEECSNGAIHTCDHGMDLGVDCANSGAGACNVFGPDGGKWLACIPVADAGACTETRSVQCSGGVATSCPADFVETLHCETLLQTESSCLASPGEAVFDDWTSPCQVITTSDAGADPDADVDAEAPPVPVPCPADSCPDGNYIMSCVRGASITVNCTLQGLGPCRIRPTDDGNEKNAQCTPP